MATSVHSREYRIFLDLLKKARKTSGLTQEEVAHALGRHQSFVSKCESGERRVDVVELKKFAELYGKSLSYFVSSRSKAER